MTGETIDGSRYGGWFSELFPSRGYLRAGLVSAGAGLGLFWYGYAVAVIGDLEYLTEIDGYLASFAVFWTLAWLGLADETYVDVWNDVRSAFDVDDGTYRTVVEPGLDRIYDGRRVLVYAAVFGIPWLLITAAIYVPGSPYRDFVAELVFEEDPFEPTYLWLAVFYPYIAVLALSFGAVLNGFVNHLGLVNEVSGLPFRDVRRAASELESLGGFTIASGAAWFVGATFFVLWQQANLDGTVAVGALAVFVFVGVVFFLAPQLVLHDALADAKRDVLAGIRAEYEEMNDLVRSSEPPENLPLRLEVTDRRLEGAEAIDTWVYDLSSVGKLVAASVIPWLALVQELVATVRLGG